MMFGLSIPTLTGFPRATEPADGGWRTRWQRSFEIVALAEELGFEIETVGHDRFTAERIDSSQPMIALAALAARTTRLRFLANILIPPTHHPIDIAEQVAMVGELFDGRVMLGVEIGYRPYEFEQLGRVFKERVSRFEEGIALLRAAWSDEPVRFQGKHLTVNGANVTPKPVQRRGPPIFIHAQVDPAIDRAATLGDGWLADNIESAAMLAPKIKRFREQSRVVGRAGTVVLNRKIGIDRDKAKLEREWLPPILDIYRNLRLGVPFDDAFCREVAFGRAEHDGRPAAGPDHRRDALWMRARPAPLHQGDQPRLYRRRLRARRARAQFENLRDQIELFGREVMPRCSDA